MKFIISIPLLFLLFSCSEKNTGQETNSNDNVGVGESYIERNDEGIFLENQGETFTGETIDSPNNVSSENIGGI